MARPLAPKKVGRYTIISGLGHSPRGESYLGEGPDGRRYAIKLLETDDAGFLEQARKLAALSDPHIAACQVGLHEDRPFVATEFLEGSNLGDWLGGAPSAAEQLRVLAGIASGLNQAHEKGVLHRALTPSNVFVLPDGECKLVDFSPSPGPAVKQSQAVAYLAPEVVSGGPCTPKSDIYSAGLLFYQVLAGHNPFTRTSPAASAKAILEDTAPPLREARDDLQRELTDAIMACLDKDPDWRPKDLSYIFEMFSGAAPAARPGKPAKAKAAAGATLPSFGAGKASAPSSRMPLLIAGVAVAVLAAAGALLWLRPGGRGRPTPAASPRPAAATPAPIASQAPAAEVAPTPAPATPEPAKAEAAVPAAKVAAAASPPGTLAPAAGGRAATPAPATPPPGAATPPPAPAVPATPEPQAPPTAAPSAAAPAPVAPLSLSNLNPPAVKRRSTTILDVHGTGLREDLHVVISRNRGAAGGVSVLRQRLVNPGLLQVVVAVDEAAAPGIYELSLAGAEGQASNALRLEVTK